MRVLKGIDPAIVQALNMMDRDQLIVALQSAAFIIVESWVDQNPAPEGATQEELAAAKLIMLNMTLTTAVNAGATVMTAPMVLTEPAAPTPQQEADAADVAAAAIAKTSGKLN